MTTSGKTLSFFPALLLLLFFPFSALAQPNDGELDYRLAISFDTERQLLTGTCKITLPPQEKLKLYTEGLHITGIVVQTADGRSHEGRSRAPEVLFFDSAPSRRDLFISYSLDTSSSRSNRVARDGIVLLQAWHPQPDRKVFYHLSASLPQGFTAVTESDIFPLKVNGRTVSAAFSSPLKTLHFAAAPYAVDHLTVRDNLKVYTLFFPEDRRLAEGYLQAAGEYIRRYESEIGPFPYNHFVITANRLPTGLGIPTFTLLGQAVLRLPFIKSTSLGHEILHSWFGSSVEVDFSQGNWCEGLTSYLADHAYRRDNGDDEAYRKETILNYLSYINDDNVIPLRMFLSADHAQPLARARRAVGYSKSLMLFHELQEKIGPDLFAASLQSFYSRYRGKSASWDDLSRVFSETAETDLQPFFRERLEREDIPSLDLAKIEVSHTETAPLLRFTIIQKTEKPYTLNVPVRAATHTGSSTYNIQVSTAETEVELELAGRPLEIVIDPEYSMLRQLTPAEEAPVWSRFLGSAKKLVVVGNEQDRQTYQPLLDTLGGAAWEVKTDNEVSNSELRDRDILFLGTDLKSAQSLFGTVGHNKKGFTLDVRSNPLNHNHTATLVSSKSSADTAATAPRLAHYGKYSFLYFQNGKILDKRITQSPSGQAYLFDKLPPGGATAPLTDFHSIAAQLSTHDVIYVGESHTSVSDHMLQLRLLEAVSLNNHRLAIGMEMFPAESQAVLDRYTLEDGTMTEREFLKKSSYFEVWSYDFRYFRDIFQFAKKHKIPVVGLNLDREIVSSVFRNGGTDNLTEQQKGVIPAERDLDLPGYGERLNEMYSVHAHSNLGTGMASGFIQAQALWDESMAENIAGYLQAHPGTTMIVFAGSQHTRKDSGIPPRVKRRINVRQASVLNILDGSQPENLADVADYFFLSPPMVLPPLGKMGILLEEVGTEQDKYVKIDTFTPASKAPDAGVQEGDTITAVNGFPIETLEDIRIAMLDAEAGTTVSVELLRPDSGETLSVSVELIGPQSSAPHP